MTILVTGSAGGFGRLFSKWVQTRFTEDVVFSGRAPGSSKQYIQCDLQIKEEIRAIIQRIRPRLIFHLAGSFSNSYESDLAVNSHSAKHIFDTLLEGNIAARVVLFGSAAEYGVVESEENPIHEDHVLRPVSIYGLTKAYQTQLAYCYARAHGIDVVVARMFNLLLPGLSDRLFVGRVERMITRVQQGSLDIIEVGNLEGVRDYVTGEEAIRQVDLIADKGRSGEVYHVGSGRPLKMRDLLEALLRDASLDWSIVRSTEGCGTRTGYDVPMIYANMTKTNALDGN